MIGHSPLEITITIITETVTAPLRSKEPGGTARAMRQISMACTSWQSLFLCWWCELERLERLSLLPQENQDENKTREFLNCHIYVIILIKNLLSKKRVIWSSLLSAKKKHWWVCQFSERSLNFLRLYILFFFLFRFRFHLVIFFYWGMDVSPLLYVLKNVEGLSHIITSFSKH